MKRPLLTTTLIEPWKFFHEMYIWLPKKNCVRDLPLLAGYLCMLTRLELSITIERSLDGFF